LLLWRAPGGVLPILLGDYLVLHFGLYGAITLAALAWAKRLPRLALACGRRLAFLAATAATTGYGVLAIGWPIDTWFTSYFSTGRVGIAAAMLLGTIPYFVADEWLTRGERSPRGAYAATKLLFLASLALAVALNLEKLFFLAIIVPAILLFFAVYGLFSHWAWLRTRHPLVGALANAVAFAMAVAAVFPVVAAH
jgi:hypothetical protein